MWRSLVLRQRAEVAQGDDAGERHQGERAQHRVADQLAAPDHGLLGALLEVRMDLGTELVGGRPRSGDARRRPPRRTSGCGPSGPRRRFSRPTLEARRDQGQDGEDWRARLSMTPATATSSAIVRRARLQLLPSRSGRSHRAPAPPASQGCRHIGRGPACRPDRRQQRRRTGPSRPRLWRGRRGGARRGRPASPRRHRPGVEVVARRRVGGGVEVRDRCSRARACRAAPLSLPAVKRASGRSSSWSCRRPRPVAATISPVFRGGFSPFFHPASRWE